MAEQEKLYSQKSIIVNPNDKAESFISIKVFKEITELPAGQHPKQWLTVNRHNDKLFTLVFTDEEELKKIRKAFDAAIKYCL